VRYKIQVTEEDIDEGTRGDTRHCAFARAMQRAGIGDPVVDGRHWSGRIEGVPFSGGIPSSITAWIRDFDSHKAVHPKAFVIDFDESALATNDGVPREEEVLVPV